MSVYTSLSGIQSAQLDLNTTSNNLANANTFGFKESRAEFGDVYSYSLFTNSATTPGGGAKVQKVAQQFNEGSNITTNNPLDMRIAGRGFFAVSHSKEEPGTNQLTRNGAFHLDNENNIVNSQDQFLLGYAVNPVTDEVTSFEPSSIQIPAQFGQPIPSSEMELSLNLPANAEIKDLTLFDPNDETTFNNSTSSTIYDSIGSSYKMTTYYAKSALNTWNVYYTVTDAQGEKPLNIAGGNSTAGNGHVGHTLAFNNDGSLNNVNGGNPIQSVAMGTVAGIQMAGDPTQSFEMDFSEMSQYAAPFDIKNFKSNGTTVGYLTKVDIDKRGTILGSYSNGETMSIARVAMASVNNEQGLEKKGSTQWDATRSSGAKLWGESSKGGNGTIQSGLLEQSNIDMTQELVDVISAQRNFQANSRALEVHNQLQQNIIQIR